MRMAGRWSVRLSLLVAVVSGARRDLPPSRRSPPAKSPASSRIRPAPPFPARPSRSPNVDTNLQRVIVSSGEGVYTAPSLAPGDYRVDVELAGFKPMRREGIRLSTGEKARIDFDLAVGNISEQVTVTADAPILRAETASLGTVVEHEQVVQLPLNGRSFITARRPRARASRCRPTRRCRASTAAGRAPTSISSTASPCCSPSRGRWRSSRSSTRSRSSRSRATARRPSSAGSTAASSTSPPRRAPTRFTAPGSSSSATRRSTRRTTSRRPIAVKPDYRRNQFGGIARRPAGQGPHVLLRRLPGTAPVDRPHRHLHRADAAAAAGHLHGGDRRPRAGDLRSGDDGRLDAAPVCRQHDSDRHDGSGRAVAAAALPAADGVRRGQQLQPDRQRDRQPGSVGRRASITSSRPTAISCSAGSRTSGTGSCR